MPTITDIFTDRSAFSSEEECVEVAVKHAAQFDWDWKACNLLRRDALAEYHKAIAAALTECDKATTTVWDEYDKDIDPALDEYRKACATSFARLWFNDKEAA